MRASVLFSFVIALVVIQCLFSTLYIQEVPVTHEKLGLSQRGTLGQGRKSNTDKIERESRYKPVMNGNKGTIQQSSSSAPIPSASPTPSSSTYDEPQPGARELGWKAREDINKIHEDNGIVEVIMVPHSHCDAGWLKTFDRYYQDEVKHILTTVTQALTNNPHRKFSWVEVSFLEKWWVQQNNEMKQNFRRLYENGQIEFLMGGWVSNDEATVTYMQCINQMTDGHRFLQREFGEKAIPRIGWQIDPFGLSQATATMFSQMCFDANAAWRVAGSNRRGYVDNKMLEFIWRGSDTLGPSSDLLLHLLPWSYATSDEFLFEKAKSLRLNNEADIARAADKLVDSFKVRTEAYPTNTLMWPWGHDFMFTDANKMFDSMDKVINYINNKPEYKVNVRYGTPAEYFDTIHSKEITFPMLQQDFLPYGPTVINWWNGYYTSRPLLKGYCRYLDAIQRTAEFVYTWARSSNPSALGQSKWEQLFDRLEAVRHVQGIMQHHDAITGTMREHVLQDYYNMITKSSNDCAFVIETVAPILTSTPDNLPSDVFLVKPGDTVSVPDIIESPKFLLLFNSLPWSRTEIFSVSIDTPLAQVYDATQKRFIPSSVLPPAASYVDGAKRSSAFRLHFETEVPALGYSLFVLHYAPARSFEDTTIFTSDDSLLPSGLGNKMPGVNILTQLHSKERFIENEDVRLTFNDLGNIQSIMQKNVAPYVLKNGTRATSATLDINKHYWTYKSDSAWDNHYTFKALDDGTQDKASNAKFYLIRTPLVQELYQKVNDKLAHRFILFKNQNQVQVSDFVGPPDRGINYITRYSTSLESDGHFYTDDSGLEMVKRAYNTSDIYSGNYYPMVYSSFIREEDYPFSENHFRQLSIVTDRTHGITSVSPGSFDLMLHRNTLQSYGNGEKMEDWNPVEIVSWLLVTKDDNFQRQQIAMRRNFPLTAVHYQSSESETFSSDMLASQSFVGEEFPADVFLMNLDYHSRNSDTVALRVNNLRQKKVFELYETPQVSDRLQVSFDSLEQEISLFDVFNSATSSLASVDERSLSLNQKIEDCKRHHWHDNAEANHSFKYGDSLLQQTSPVTSGHVSLPPLGIRSFLVTFTNK